MAPDTICNTSNSPHGTFHTEGVEFVLPGLFKATKREWAEDFLENGTLYFTELSKFRNDEHEERGDPLEGTFAKRINGSVLNASVANPVFVWCSTMETDIDAILDTWSDRDTVLQITAPKEFFQRIIPKAHEVGLLNWQVGPVTYDKDDGSVRTHHWGEGIFQKGHRFRSQKEYRLAMIGKLSGEYDESIRISLGNCRNIATIVD